MCNRICETEYLDWSWDAGTQTLTATWDVSPRADVAGYRVHSSGGARTDGGTSPGEEKELIGREDQSRPAANGERIYGRLHWLSVATPFACIYTLFSG